MLFRLARVLEIISAIVCIHRLYDRKVKPGISTVSVVLGSALIFDMVNEFGFSSYFAAVVYGIIGIYCVYQFKDTVWGAVKSVFLMLFILTVLQFLFLVILSTLTKFSEETTGVVVNILVAASCAWVLPKRRVAILRKSINTHGKFLLPVIVFMLSIVLLLQFQWKILNVIYADFFVLSIPAGLLLLWMTAKWETSQQEKTMLENELRIARPMQESYEKLMKEIRLRQHEYKNHLTAILSTHYTCNSYEKLVRAQKKYCGMLVQENKYNSLLMLGDAVFTGFLYEKFRSIEADGICIEYEIRGRLDSASLPVYYLVEITGILLDNAVEAVQEKAMERILKIGFHEMEDRYCFEVGNKYPYVAPDEIGSWFQMGKSTKGSGRGLGLYHVKKICEEWNCCIICKNFSVEGENWIKILFEFDKADTE